MYHVQFSASAVKQLKRLDKNTARIIKNWTMKHLVDTTDPRQHEKALTGNFSGVWRYRAGGLPYVYYDKGRDDYD